MGVTERGRRGDEKSMGSRWGVDAGNEFETETTVRETDKPKRPLDEQRKWWGCGGSGEK
ncbi:hypothetical protein [Haladaptatus sp. CMAA 1909]|uniref:hypothetical protein n=1 Tax=Haladaptatus sp. CMAA 1909 TaxID=3368986 RepID=UPI0037547905